MSLIRKERVFSTGAKTGGSTVRQEPCVRLTRLDQHPDESVVPSPEKARTIISDLSPTSFRHMYQIGSQVRKAERVGLITEMMAK